LADFIFILAFTGLAKVCLGCAYSHITKAKKAMGRKQTMALNILKAVEKNFMAFFAS
jgi:hypothetical protein